MGASPHGTHADALVTGASTDSRKVGEGDLFFALRGTTDGADFAPEAHLRGAVATVASRRLDVPTLVVDDPLQALQRLARWSLLRGDAPSPTVVGITGTVGKTTAKDALATILRHAGKRVSATVGNFNNEIGLPLTILSSDPRTEVLVLEMGATHPGDIEYLCAIAPPEIGVLTADAPAAATGSGRNIERRITFARSGEADLLASEIESTEEGLRFVASIAGESAEVRSPVFGTHLVEPLLASIGGAIALGLDLEQAARGLSRLKRTGLRGDLYRLREDITVYDDSYNASPAAVAAVLTYGAEQASKQGRRLVVVLGGMFELGACARAYHREAGELAAQVGVDLLVCVGDEARWYAETFPGRTLFYPDAASAAATLREELRGGDYLVVKGSRGVGLDTLTRTLKESLALV